MKKAFLLLPIMALGLTACSNNASEPAPAAEVTSVAMPDWQSQGVQPVAMPSSMNQPTYQPPVQPSVQPQYQPQPVPAMPQPVAQPNYNTMGQTESVGNCQVVRDGANAPIYAQIQKGCYTDASYTVGKHDTVFLVAYLAGKSVAEIATLNHLSQPYQLKMGQVLRLK